LLQGLLRLADVGSVVRRAPGFDAPEFLATGPLVAASDVPVARDVLREVDPGEPQPLSRSGADRPSRVLAGLLIAVALVAFVVCIATDVLADTATLLGQVLSLVAVDGRALSAPLANRHRRVRSAADDHGIRSTASRR
jgi:hypothetical protein